MEPYIDINAIYQHLQPKQLGRRIPKQTKSLATICKEVLEISLSKVCIHQDLQCPWSNFLIEFKNMSNFEFCSDLLTYFGCISFRNISAVTGLYVHYQKSRRHMLLQMLTVCSKYLRCSMPRLLEKVDFL